MASVVTEKRTTPRIQPYIVPCLIVEGERRLAGFITDLSPRGGRAACEGEAPASGASVVLEFRIGREVASSRLRATVKWVRPGPRGHKAVGFRFEKVAKKEQHALDAVVEDFRRRVAEIGQG